MLQGVAILIPGGVIGARAFGNPSGIIDRILVAMTLHADRHPQLRGQRIAGRGTQCHFHRGAGALEIAQLAARLTKIDPVKRFAGRSLRGSGVRLFSILPATCQGMGDATAPVALSLLVHGGLGR